MRIKRGRTAIAITTKSKQKAARKVNVIKLSRVSLCRSFDENDYLMPAPD